MYYLLDDTYFDEKNHYLFYGVLYDSKKKVVENIFDDGVKDHEINSPFVLILDESDSLLKNRVFTDRISNSTIEAGILLLVSPKAQDLLLKFAPNDIELYDIQVKGSAFNLDNYKIVKILDKIDCIDLENSIVEYDPDFDSIDSAEMIVLDEKKIPKGKKIFLLGKRRTGIIVAHESLKNEIDNAGLIGFKFCSLEDAYMVIS